MGHDAQLVILLLVLSNIFGYSYLSAFKSVKLWMQDFCWEYFSMCVYCYFDFSETSEYLFHHWLQFDTDLVKG